MVGYKNLHLHYLAFSVKTIKMKIIHLEVNNRFNTNIYIYVKCIPTYVRHVAHKSAQ